MKGFLLDTNVISELVKPTPDSNVVEFLSTANDTRLSIISLHELTYGLRLLPVGQRRSELETKIEYLLSDYNDCIIPIKQPESDQAALFRVNAKRNGRVMHLADALIAGTAKAHNLCMVTRNTNDFIDAHIDIINPWGKSM